MAKAKRRDSSTRADTQRRARQQAQRPESIVAGQRQAGPRRTRTDKQVWLTRICAVLVLLGLGEGLARVFDDKVSAAANAVSGNVNDRINAMRDVGAQASCIDLVLVGSSLTFAGLDTQELAAVWPNKPSPSTYNAALQSFSVAVWPWWIENEVVPLLRPRNVVLSLDTGLDWASEDSTDLYQQDFDHLEVREGRQATGLGKYSALIRNRAALRQINVIATRGNNTGGGFPGITQWGTFPPFAALPSFTQVSDGVVPQELLDRVAQRAKSGFSARDGERALRDAISAARDGGARVFVLDPPVVTITNLTRDQAAQRQRDLADRRSQIEAIARDAGATPIHLSDALADPKYWSDTHFNAWGSQRAIAELAQVLNKEGVEAHATCARSAIPTTSVYIPMPAGPTTAPNS